MIPNIRGVGEVSCMSTKLQTSGHQPKKYGGPPKSNKFALHLLYTFQSLLLFLWLKLLGWNWHIWLGFNAWCLSIMKFVYGNSLFKHNKRICHFTKFVKRITVFKLNKRQTLLLTSTSIRKISWTAIILKLVRGKKLNQKVKMNHFVKGI